MSTTTESIAEVEMVRGAEWSLVVPHLNGVPLSAAQETVLFEWLNGRKRRDRAPMNPRVTDSARRSDLERAQRREADLVRVSTRSFLAIIARLLGPAAGITFRTLDGRAVDAGTLNLQGAATSVFEGGIVLWSDAPPRLTFSPVVGVK